MEGLARAFFTLDDDDQAAVTRWRTRDRRGGDGSRCGASSPPARLIARRASTSASSIRPGTTRGRRHAAPRRQPVPTGRPRSGRRAWLDALRPLADALMRGIAVGLGLPAEWFERHLTGDPTVLFRIFHYPALPDNAEADEWGVGEHTDYGLLTLLAQDEHGGLQVRTPPGDWLDVPAEPGVLVCNIGDMLDRLTEGRYRSTPHRVRNVGREPTVVPVLLRSVVGCRGRTAPARRHPACRRRRSALGRQQRARLDGPLRRLPDRQGRSRVPRAVRRHQRKLRLTALAKRRPRRVSTHRSPASLDQAIERVAVECLDRHAVAHAQHQLSPSNSRVSASSVSLGRLGRLARRDELDVALGRAHVPPAPAVLVRVGGAAEPEVVVLAPVQEVVPALVAGPGPVRDLVVLAGRRRRAASSATSYLSAWSSSSGCRAGSSASGVPGSTVRPYADTCGGSSASAASTVRRQSSSDSPAAP